MWGSVEAVGGLIEREMQGAHRFFHHRNPSSRSVDGKGAGVTFGNARYQ